MDAVILKNVKKQLGEFQLDIKDLAIKQGYITGFVGENGAGKTTTMKLIMEMLLPDEGTIRVLGENLKESVKFKEKIGYVGEPTGYPEESKLKHIHKMIVPFYKDWDEKLFKQYTQQFKLNMSKKYGELSTGQKKQFALCMALAHHPQLILLDEPTSGLDPVVRNEMIDLLMEHMQDEKVSVFYSTHITSDLERACDYLIYLQEGMVILNEEKDKLLDTFCVVRGPKSVFSPTLSNKLIGFRINQLGGEGLVSSREEAEALFGREVKYERPTIEDLMLFLAKKGA